MHSHNLKIQVDFPSWFSQLWQSPRQSPIPTAISTPLSHVLLVFPAVFPHFLSGFHVLHWTWRSFQFTGHRIYQIVSLCLWRISHLIWFLRTCSYLGWAQVAPIRLRQKTSGGERENTWISWLFQAWPQWLSEALSNHITGNTESISP